MSFLQDEPLPSLSAEEVGSPANANATVAMLNLLQQHFQRSLEIQQQQLRKMKEKNDRVVATLREDLEAEKAARQRDELCLMDCLDKLQMELIHFRLEVMKLEERVDVLERFAQSSSSSHQLTPVPEFTSTHQVSQFLKSPSRNLVELLSETGSRLELEGDQREPPRESVVEMNCPGDIVGYAESSAVVDASPPSAQIDSPSVADEEASAEPGLAEGPAPVPEVEEEPSTSTGTNYVISQNKNGQSEVSRYKVFAGNSTELDSERVDGPCRKRARLENNTPDFLSAVSGITDFENESQSWQATGSIDTSGAETPASRRSYNFRKGTNNGLIRCRNGEESVNHDQIDDVITGRVITPDLSPSAAVQSSLDRPTPEDGTASSKSNEAHNTPPIPSFAVTDSPPSQLPNSVLSRSHEGGHDIDFGDTATDDRAHSTQPDPPQGLKFECIFCSKRFFKGCRLEVHIRTHTLESQSSLDTSTPEEETGPTGSLRRDGAHITHPNHSPSDTGNPPYQPPTSVLSRSCGVAHDLDFGDTAADDRAHSTQPDSPQGSKFECLLCSKRFAYESLLEIHLRTHTLEKPFKCDTCDKTFRKKDHLKVHHRIHAGEKAYSCSTCPKRFTQLSTLQRHMRTHTGEKIFSCTTCNKCFSDKSNLKKHERVHLKNKNTTN